MNSYNTSFAALNFRAISQRNSVAHFGLLAPGTLAALNPQPLPPGPPDPDHLVLNRRFVFGR